MEAVTIDDKYTLASGRAFMTGVQALVRLPLLQRQRDAVAGHNTAAFISGYRGSPLGTYDQALWQAKKHLAENHVVFQPGVNEELGATAVWGSQQLEFDAPSKKYDGVFGIWYGKGPGVDRSGDVLKHANLAGTAPLGGVIALAGDDHVSKSSTLAHQSDHTFMACGLPVFFPSSVQDILDLGVHAFAMSRFSGLWAGMKTVQEVVESGASVVTDADRVRIVLPEDFTPPQGGLHIRWPDDPLGAEARMMEYKWPAALAYVRANRLNRNVVEGPDDRLGIVASGKAYSDTRQALLDLGLDDATCRHLGIRVHKVAVVWPLEPEGVRDFARGLREILVVEEKRPIIEQQLKDELYHQSPDRRPAVFGKYGHNAGGEWSHRKPGEDWLLRAKADLSPALVARAIAQRLAVLGVPADVQARMDLRLREIEARERAAAQGDSRATDRLPWFCPGCPHNTSTKVPEGSIAMAGIGCHGMVTWMDRNTTSWTQMGGEGVPWMGQSAFSTRKHMFANLGDGTYNHSGLLAVRQSIHAGVNLTYKILFNSAVAMTGGQPVDGGELDVPAMSRELAAEGARLIVVVTDEPAKYQGVANLAPGVTIRHRDELDTVQRELREMQGVTVIIYDQACATKKRRERKRGTMPDPAKRVVINELVCEGCGDCSVQSNCMAVQPVETEFGRKRKVNQDTCSKDFSCVKGFCPSFVTVEGGKLRKPAAAGKATPSMAGALPYPALPDATRPHRILVAGIGGTGIVTIGAVMGMAAHLEGKGVITQDATGMAQMGGATWSHIQIAASPDDLHASRVDMAMADLVIACDAVVGGGKATVATMSPERTFVVLNSHVTPTAAFMQNPDWTSPGEGAVARITQAVGADRLATLNAEQVATQLLGQSIYANLLMLGYAWQKGQVPLSHQALMRAIELNAVQVESNKAAFEWGRLCAHDMGKVPLRTPDAQVIQFARKTSVPELVNKHVAFLTAYQNAAYASQYADFVATVHAVEGKLGGNRLTEAVARSLFKLMAYKDEYEVARLHTDASFRQQIEGMFEGNVRIVHHLAPPLFAKKNAQGEPVKAAYGPWMRSAFGVLAKLKGLRGTAFDPFGYTAERREERAIIGEYRESIETLLHSLDRENLELALEFARLPQEIRGYGHVKARNLAAARGKWAKLMGQWRSGGAAGAASARVNVAA